MTRSAAEGRTDSSGPGAAEPPRHSDVPGLLDCSPFVIWPRSRNPSRCAQSISNACGNQAREMRRFVIRRGRHDAMLHELRAARDAR